jgi:hypothetical protein
MCLVKICVRWILTCKINKKWVFINEKQVILTKVWDVIICKVQCKRHKLLDQLNNFFMWLDKKIKITTVPNGL